MPSFKHIAVMLLLVFLGIFIANRVSFIARIIGPPTA